MNKKIIVVSLQSAGILILSTVFTSPVYGQTACQSAGGACTTIGICNANCVPNPVPGMPACGGAAYGCPATQPACCNPRCPAGQSIPFYTCSGGACVPTNSCGISSCSNNAQCGSPPPQPTQPGGGGPPPPPGGCPNGQTNPHGVCIGGNPSICQSVPGCGTNACTIGSTCTSNTPPNPPPVLPPPPESSPLYYDPVDSVRDTTFLGVFILGLGLLLSYL